MKKIIIILITVSVLLLGCNKEESKESLEQKISKNKEQIIKLKQANKELDKKMEKFSDGNGRKEILVKAEKIKSEVFEHTFQANGSVEAISEAYISSEMLGRIDKIHVSEGLEVKRGTLLVSLNSSVIENNIDEIKTNLNLARIVFEKRQELWDKKIGSEVEYLSAKTNKESLEKRLKSFESQLDMTQIKAPINGIVDRIERKKGELASPGQLIVLMVNLKKVYINAALSENYLPYVKKGDQVKVSFPSFSGFTREAPISRVGKTINAENRTFQVQLVLDNLDETLKPNLIALLEIRDHINNAAVIVPSIVIKKDTKGSYLYRISRDGKYSIAEKVYIKEGLSSGNRTVVNEGIKFGDQVIVEGYNFVQDGSKIRVK